jgi:O-antigen/teichoic acid export membrane protein
MQSYLKQIGKDSIVYGVGAVFAKSIGFLLLPIYTRIFNTADYGAIAMFGVLNSLLGSVLVMGMDSAQSFYFFEQRDKGVAAQARVVTAILQWRMAWGITVIVTASILSPFLNSWFFNGKLSWEYFVIAFSSVFFAQIVGQSAQVFRLIYRPIGYIGITLTQTLLSAAVALVLIIVFEFGIIGFFLGSLTGALVATCFGWWQVRTYLDWTGWHKTWWPRLVKFGLPLMPTALTMFVMNTSDRLFVNHYNGMEALGLYAVGAKIAAIIALVVGTFRMAWWPVAMDAMHGPEGTDLFKSIGRLYLGLGSAAVVLITALSPYLIRWLAPPEYFNAYPIIGTLSWFAIFYGFYLISSAGIWKAEKTAWAPLLMGIAAFLNIGLNYWLVPRYGALAAAATTSISFFVWNVLAIALSERLWRVGYDYGILLFQVSLGVATSCHILIAHNKSQGAWNIWVIAAISIVVLIGLSVPAKYITKIIKHRVFSPKTG